MAEPTSKLDACEVCGGTRGGEPGNENIIDGVVMCDYCTGDKRRADDKTAEHTPLPYMDVDGTTANMTDEWHEIVSPDGRVIATLEQEPHCHPEAAPWTAEEVRANANFIAGACNCHDDLLAACEAALSHVQELREAWQTGAISERDGRGGTRSNRNADIDTKLRKAIAKAKGTTDGN